MSSLLPMRAAVATLDDDAWEDLLNFIEERRVIPIIGPELLQVETDTGPRLLYDWVAEKLATRLNVDTADLRHLRRGHAGIHLRSAKRTPDARAAFSRARAQPSALHRQQLHELA